ncbi:11275_t:CDS:10 [Acaulospora colombiana]|uniref:11275_t:CDS:1 n=1 Tax=Acaulospora colombiana TaxID=27376 RepID=A0ACA9MRA0_9GLOM|nr:11275_t:CDS:10 [Acaulospora colombiana]
MTFWLSALDTLLYTLTDNAINVYNWTVSFLNVLNPKNVNSVIGRATAVGCLRGPSVNISMWAEAWRLAAAPNLRLLPQHEQLAQASLWDDGFDADILGDSPIAPLVTPAPEGGYHEALLRESFGLPPLNATIGGGVFHRLVAPPPAVALEEATTSAVPTSQTFALQKVGVAPRVLRPALGCPMVSMRRPVLSQAKRVKFADSLRPKRAVAQAFAFEEQPSTSIRGMSSPYSRFYLLPYFTNLYCEDYFFSFSPVSRTNSSTITTPTQTSSVSQDLPTSNSSIPIETSSSVPDDPPPDPSTSITISSSVPDDPTPTDDPNPTDDPTPTDDPAPTDDPIPTDDPAPSDEPTVSLPMDTDTSADVTIDAVTQSIVDPPSSDPPSNTVLPFVATVSEEPSSTVIVETSVSNGVTRTVSRTVATSHSTATNANLQLDGSDAVAMEPAIMEPKLPLRLVLPSSSHLKIAVLSCNGSKSGSFSVQVDGNPASTLNGYQAPGPDGDQCIISEPYKSDVMADAAHAITVIVKGSTAGGSSDATQFEFGGFVYRGIHATGTKTDSGKNLPAIIGGTIGGVLGGIAIIVIIVIVVIRRRRNRRIDNAPAAHQQPAPTPAFTNPTYVSVPTTEYHDPYASSGYGPQHYPNPTGSSYTGGPPPWTQTSQGPFGSGSFTPAQGRAY